MIQGVVVRELGSSLDERGLGVEIWNGENAPQSPISSYCRSVFPGVVEAWSSRDKATERIICLEGMIKLVLCDRREGSPTLDEVDELFLGEYRLREAIIPGGVLRGWKAVGSRTALVLFVLEGGEDDERYLTPREADVPYDWDIVMQ